MAIRQAIITYDPIRFHGASSAEDSSLNWILERGLRCEDYPRERGIISIRPIPEGNELIVAPIDGTDILMSFNPCITLPLDLVEHLVKVAERGCGSAGSDKRIVDKVREEIAGTRKMFDSVQIVAVPRMKLGPVDE